MFIGSLSYRLYLKEVILDSFMVKYNSDFESPNPPDAEAAQKTYDQKGSVSEVKADEKSMAEEGGSEYDN
jgi:hypothetical protein